MPAIIKPVAIAAAASTALVTATLFASIVVSTASEAQEAKRTASETECTAKPYHKWLPPHRAGEINPRSCTASGCRTFKRDSKGSCRLDTKAVRAAIDAGTVK